MVKLQANVGVAHEKYLGLTRARGGCETVAAPVQKAGFMTAWW